MDRRTFVKGMCLGGAATFAFPAVRFAHVPGRGKLVFVLLRGGFDGLAAVVPISDPDYARVRGAMTYAASDLTPLTTDFALAPGLASWKELWDAREMLVLHAMAIPYRTRSHFDGQSILETGLEHPDHQSDGWLNRLLQIMEGKRSGIAVAAGMPRSMLGSHPVASWAPSRLDASSDGYIDRLALLYRGSEHLHDRFEAALQLRDLAPADEAGMGERGIPRARMDPILRAAATVLREPDGPNVAAMEFSGWDTHALQGIRGGQLDRLLDEFASAILVFRRSLGPTWRDTTVVVMTEFGRTARPNGTNGTDHGTAGAGFILGPNVAGSRIVADWPGLTDRTLFEGRDLESTLDTRAVLKGVVSGVFDMNAAQANRIFPGSDSVRALSGLMG
jgi:uncharacterized protein (DUF1501 family)